METTFTAGFIGLGLIGGSIARALKKYYPDCADTGTHEKPPYNRIRTGTWHH